MSTTDPTAAQFSAYRAMWAYFNAVLFGGSLDDVFLNLSRLKRSKGFFAAERWRDAGNQIAHEISLNPAHLKPGSAKDAASTFVHELVHLWRHGQRNPPRNGYHDRVWGKKMESLGLMPSSTAAPGGARTGYRMSHYIVPGGAFEVAFEAMPVECHLPWTCGIDDESRKGGDKKEKKEKEAARKVKLKYSCPRCELNVWGRAGLRLRCDDCNKELVTEGDGAAANDCVAIRKAA